MTPVMASARWLQNAPWFRRQLNKWILLAKSMNATRSRNLRLALLTFGIVLLYGFAVTIPDRSTIPTHWEHRGWRHRAWSWRIKAANTQLAESMTKVGHDHDDADLGRITNRTLGFEKVFSIGLNERTDKRDALTLMSSLTGFDIEWIEGVRPGNIPDKAVPFGIDASAVRDNFLGTWRGHMNVIRHIVEKGISSALVMEDDMDWDVHLKSQLETVARGARHIFPEPSRTPNSPYGDSWDILWLGHCGDPFPEMLEENTGLEDHALERISTKYLAHDDETVPPYSQVSNLVNWELFPARTRVVHMSAAPLCSFSYAVSQSGARKLLHALSVDGLHMAFDNSLAQICRDAVFDLARERDGGYSAKCISVSPTMMFHHKAKGLISADSDIQSYGKGGDVREKGVTDSIMWSTRLNLLNVLTGKPLDAQFIEDPDT